MLGAGKGNESLERAQRVHMKESVKGYKFKNLFCLATFWHYKRFTLTDFLFTGLCLDKQEIFLWIQAFLQILAAYRLNVQETKAGDGFKFNRMSNFNKRNIKIKSVLKSTRYKVHLTFIEILIMVDLRFLLNCQDLRNYNSLNFFPFTRIATV